VILEGFEIENWACIKRLSVSDLPPKGVIVLHGPNRTGKSSIVQALRACLMDYPSSSKAKEITNRYPRGTGEKPTISVTFRNGATTYRIKKCYGTNKSELATRTCEGSWRVETADAGEAHRLTCTSVGGDDSRKGLHQLLWLTQAEFRLPDRKTFDPDVQSQLRGVLGVLQTALDDRFIAQVKKRWNQWYAGQRKPGKERAMKDGCDLVKRLDRLVELRRELNEREGEFARVEEMLKQVSDVEFQKIHLQEQLEQCLSEMVNVKGESERSQERIRARREAERDYAAAEKERNAALEARKGRAEAANRLVNDEKLIPPAEKQAENAQQHAESIKLKRSEQRTRLAECREKQRAVQMCLARVQEGLRRLANAENLAAAEGELQRAQAVAQKIEEIKKYLSDRPAPETPELDALRSKRDRYLQLQAERDAASMRLTVFTEKGACAAELALDGGSPCNLQATGDPLVYAVRRTAKLRIEGWGRIELTRGATEGDLDHIEREMQKCQQEFADSLARFGIGASESQALDTLVGRCAERRVANDELSKQTKELKKLAPKGLESLQQRVVELRTKLQEALPTGADAAEPLPSDRSKLEALVAQLGETIASLDLDIVALESDGETIESDVTQASQAVADANTRIAEIVATVKRSREILNAMPSEDELDKRLTATDDAVARLQQQLKDTELTAAESTIGERLEAAEAAVRALRSQIDANMRQYDFIRGRLHESEGLHARRSSLAARVDELTRVTDRETLERNAIDRLYELFEECREKQLGAVMAPIHDRVVRWMRLLDLGDYRELRFDDAFLPEKLVNRDGAVEFSVDEESTGAQEQIGMLVRLALGSTLASTSEPAVAILDDPLTHCDSSRLNKMRVILRRAAEGDPALAPPAGPLQIIILTCHPEWFRDENATVIDLQNSNVMSRYPG
jgi:DNA repair exonuclease SbcCD ATPase subunit